MSPFLAWGDFHARSTIPEEKWGTTRSLRTVSDNSLTWALYGSSASFRVRDRVKQLNIRGYIPCKVSEHVEGVLCSSRSRLLVVFLFTEIK